MSAGGHKVQRILLELTNSESETYASDEKEFSVLLNNSLSQVLEELLDEVDIADTTIQIPKIDLNLGTIQRPFQKEAIVSLFKEKLRSQLGREVEREQAETKASRTEIDTLIYFLRNGILPWWTATLPAVTHFNDQTFRTEFKTCFFSEATNTWIERLVKQFTYKELGSLILELVNNSNKKTFDAIDQIIVRLSASDNFSKRKIAQRILKKSLNELILQKGSIRPFSGFITEFISEDPELKELNIRETSEYLEEPALRSIPELIESKKDLPEERYRPNLPESKIQFDFPDKEKILFHYLSFRSLPKGDFSISKNELDFFVTEFILKGAKKLRNLLSESTDSQETFIELLLSLPEHHFKTLVAAVSAKTGRLSGLLKKQIHESFSKSVSSIELRTLASVLILNQALKKNEVSVTELFVQSQVLLSTSEKIKLKEFLSKIDPEFTVPKDLNAITQKESGKINAAYFSDLLNYLFEHQSWPWWGKAYSKIYPGIQPETPFEKALESVVWNFESFYPVLFAEFTRDFINTSVKPSLVFTKLNWELSKTLLDKAFPFFRNSLADTVEAILELITRHKKSGVQTPIVAQQLILFLADQKKEARSDFKQLVNAIITTVAVKLNTPLWEIYKILLKNYKSLVLKNELTKEEATSIFAYHEQLEDQYVKESQSIIHTNDPVLKSLSEISFITDQNDSLLTEYINGEDSALMAFPSAWALGAFIAERLKHSPALLSTFKKYLTGNDFRVIYRSIQLEKLSNRSWIGNLLENREDDTLRDEVFALLRNLTSEKDIILGNIIRTSFIKEKHFAGKKFSADKFRLLLQTIADESGIEFQTLELGILQSLSAGRETGILLGKILSEPVPNTETQTPEDKSFVSQLRELEFKKQLPELVKKSEDLSDAGKVAELLVKLEAIKNKKEVLSWLESVPEFRNEKIVLESLEKTEDQAETSFLIRSLKISLEPVLETTLIKLIGKQEKPPHIRSLIGLAENISIPEKKQELLNFINSNYYGDKKIFKKFIEQIDNLPGKSSLLELVGLNFPEKNFVEENFENLKSKQKSILQEWKEKLNFEAPLTDDFIQTSILKNFNSEKLKEIREGTIHENAIGSLIKKDPETPKERNIAATRPENKIQNTRPQAAVQETKDSSGEKEMPVKNPYQLSPESIADIAIHFFFNLELPWWSPVKDITTFEKLLQDLSWSSPFILKNKFFETAEYHASYFQTIGSGLITERNEKEPKPLTKEELEGTLKEDLNYLSLIVSEKNGNSSLDLLIAEILLKFGALALKPGEFKEAFRKIAVLVLSTIDPGALENFTKNKSPEETSELWRQAVEAAAASPDLLREEQGQIRDYLKTLEEKHNPEGLLKGISITDNLFSILDPGASYTNEELLSTWLQMLETYTGNSPLKLKEEIRLSGIALTQQYSTAGKKEIIKPAPQLQSYLKALEEKYNSGNLLKGASVTDELFSTLDPENLPPVNEFIDRWIQLLEKATGAQATNLKEEILQSRELNTLEESFAKEKNVHPLQDYLNELEEKYTQEDLSKSTSVTDKLFSSLRPGHDPAIRELLATWLQRLESSARNSIEEIKETLEDSTLIRKIAENERRDKELTTSAKALAETNSVFLLPYTNYLNVLTLILNEAENISAVGRKTALRLASQLFTLKELKGDISFPFGIVFRYLESKGISKTELTGIIQTFKDQNPKPGLQSIFSNVRDIATNIPVKNIYAKEAETNEEIIPGTQPGLQEAINEIVNHFQNRIPVLEKLASLTDPDKNQETKKAVAEQTYTREMPGIDLEGRIYVPNAGFVLLWPFLSRLFSNLKYTDKGKFTDPEKQLRAIHLTQYLVGFTEDHPEYTLMLNKLICGMELTEPIERSVDLTEEEKTEGRNLIAAVLAQWKEMNNTSPENFQRTFLQREGVIWQKDGNWYVKTEHTPFDILLLKLPWGLSIIKYPWNNYLIFVEWKAMN